MTKHLMCAALVGAVVAMPAQAGNLLTDSFDAESGGGTVLNYTGFATFIVNAPPGSGVDLLANGAFGLACASPGGSCVDLAGTPGPATLVSSASYNFAAGETITLAVDLSGNQRPGAGSSSDNYDLGFNFGGINTTLTNFGFNFFGTANDLGPTINSGFSVSSSVLFSDPFARRSIYFTAGQAGTLTFSIGTDSADDFGPIIDNVSLDSDAVTAVPEPASWAMMIGGFGLVGGALRRRATRSTVSFA